MELIASDKEEKNLGIEKVGDQRHRVYVGMDA